MSYSAEVQEMSDSQVSGGFWSQLPKAFSSTYEMNKHKVQFHYKEDVWEVRMHLGG